MNYKVLICDDEEYILEAVQYVVKRAGFLPVLAHDGKEVLELAQDTPPDLVILDIGMPQMDGFQVCQELKKDERTQEVPVLILTARGNETDAVRSMDYGAAAFMTKPFSPRKLEEKIKELMDV